jgi:HEAT repeat protein
MDQKNRLFTFVTCMACGLATLAIAYACFVYYRPPERSAGSGIHEGTHTDLPQNRTTASFDNQWAERLYAQRVQIKRLQTLLAQQSALLKEKTTVLQRKTAEQEQLRNDLNETFDLMAILLQETSPTGDSAEKNEQEVTRLKDNLKTMRAQAAKLQEGDLQLRAELELFEAELTASDERLTAWQQRAAEQAQAIQTLQRAFRDLAGEAVLAAGAEATPVLMSALTHRDPEIRVWAATMLGEIGPAARTAAPALVEALTDEDADVRLAARHALELVDMDNPSNGSTTPDFENETNMAFGERQ